MKRSLRFNVRGGVVITIMTTLALFGPTLFAAPVPSDLPPCASGRIVNFDTLVLSNCSITGQTAEDSGGGVENYGDLTLTNVVISGNTALNGGGLYNGGGTVQLVDVVIQNNTAGGLGGGIDNDGGDVYMRNVTIKNNTAALGGGGFVNAGTAVGERVAMIGNRATFGDGGALLNSDSFCLSAGWDPRGCFDHPAGGNSLIRDNVSAGNGGAIANSGTVSMADSTIDRNHAQTGDGGGAWNIGTIQLAAVTISRNTAAGAGGGLFNASGGSVCCSTVENLFAANVTIANNHAGSHGGGVYTFDGAFTALANSTVADNVADADGGGLGNDDSTWAYTEVKNTLLARNNGNCAGTIVSEGHNLDTGITCGFFATGDRAAVDDLAVGLGVLAANGGPVQGSAEVSDAMMTSALDPDGPAVDAGGADCVATDERGIPRPQGAGCDIGAFELEPQAARTVVTATIVASDKVYDGSTTAAATCTLSGVQSGDNVSCAVSGATFDTADAGAGKLVTAALLLTGPAADSYQLASESATATASITPAPAWVTPAPASKVYGTADPVLSGTLTGFLPIDSVAATFSRSLGETVAGGPYTITAALSYSGALSNYSISYTSASFTITKAPASVAPTAASKVYGAADPVLSGTLGGFLSADGVTATYSRAVGETVAGGPYAISATLSPAAAVSNYNVTYATANFTITKATPIITWADPADITYPTALSSVQLNATANKPGSFVYTPAAGTVLNVGNGQTLSVAFTPTDAANYTTASKQVHINVKAQAAVSCPEDPNAVLTLVVDHTGAAHGSLPVYTKVQAAYNAAHSGDVIGLFSQTTENVVLGGSKTLTITQCTTAKVTAQNNAQPVWDITSTGAITVIGADAVGDTIGWRLATSGHTLKAVRSTSACEYGILVIGNNNTVSVNSVSGTKVGIRVTGNTNDLKSGGSISGNSGNGVEVGASATGNTVRIGNIQSNGGNGILIDGSGNTVTSNSRVDNNSLNGILINGSNNSISNNAAGSDQGKGNNQDGIKVVGGTNTLDGNVTNANKGDGVDISGTGNKLKNHQSNQGAAGSTKENVGAEYRFANSTTVDLSGNKRNNASFTGTLSGPKFASGTYE